MKSSQVKLKRAVASVLGPKGRLLLRARLATHANLMREVRGR